MDRFDSVNVYSTYYVYIAYGDFWNYVGNVKLIGEKTNGI